MNITTRILASATALAFAALSTVTSADASARSHYPTYLRTVCTSYKQTSHGVDNRICLSAHTRRQDDGHGQVVSQEHIWASVLVPDYPGRYKCSEGFSAVYNDSTLVNRVDSNGGGHPALWHRTTPDLEPTAGCYHKYHADVNVNGYGASIMFYYEADLKYGHNESGRIGLFVNDSGSACNTTNRSTVVCSSHRVG